MTLKDILHLIGAASLLAYGLASAIKPHWVAGFLEHRLISGRGVSEFRVAHGGGLIGLSLIALSFNHPLVHQLVGWGWIGAAVVRILSYLPDRPKVTADYLAFLVLEMTLGIFLLV
jgi:hypothetical protein